MYKNLLFIYLIILLNGSLFAQDWNEIYYLEDEAQYLIEEKEYSKAVDVYRRMIKLVPEHSQAKYKIGQLYLLTDDQKSNAVSYLEEASQDIALDFDRKSLREIRTPVEALLLLGEAYQIDNRIDEATVIYNNFKDLISPDHELYPVVAQRLKTCENAKVAMNNPLRVSKTNIGEPVNNRNSNFGAVFSGDGNTVIYTSYTRNYLDNYYAIKQDGIWGKPKRISEKISGKYYLRTVGLSYDGKELYLATDDPEKNDLFVCHKEGSGWMEAEKLPKTINGKKSNETHASISQDGQTLYFTSDREGGYGGMDIYKSSMDAKGIWGEAQNLGSTVNTELNEESPVVTLNNKYLFFSSQGHSSIGGFDIFYVDLGGASGAVNLGYPANTTDDDLFYFPDNSLTSGFISAYDTTSFGKKDIYHISILTKINFAGNIINLSNGEKITNTNFDISIIDSKTSNVVESINSSNSQFEFEINPGIYTILINNEEYDSYAGQINIPDSYSESKYPFDAKLNKIEIEQEELVAEVIEQTESVSETDIKEEAMVETLIEEKPIETIVKEAVPETVSKDIPVKEVVKYVPKTSTSVGTKEKTYSVQLMALKTPVEVDYFKDLDNVKLTKYPDGYYRYTVGNTGSYTEAQEIKSKIHKIGYKDAFIRINEISSKYTIQIMALIIPVKPEHFTNLSFVEITKGSDDYFRYTVGSFNTYEDAIQELGSLKLLGYNQAYVKKSN